jgi:5'-deoxynucleotidase YfbR-like HD superfamily hydrolase
MNKSDFSFFMQSYTLEHTKRYSMKPTIHSESVATHSFFVALGVLLLQNDYAFNVDTAIKMALCHDLAEMEISDVNHLVKKNYPVVAKALKEAEEEIVTSFPWQVMDYCKMYKGDSAEALIVHYADALQCLQYSTNEINLGNQGYMVDVLENSNRRLAELDKKLKPYKVNP